MQLRTFEVWSRELIERGMMIGKVNEETSIGSLIGTACGRLEPARSGIN